MTSAIAHTVCIPDVVAEDEVARDVNAPTSALELSAPSLLATYFRRDGVGALVFR
jgi:hypothetical protein